MAAAEDGMTIMEERPHQEASLHHGHEHYLSFALFFLIFPHKIAFDYYYSNQIIKI